MSAQDITGDLITYGRLFYSGLALAYGYLGFPKPYQVVRKTSADPEVFKFALEFYEIAWRHLQKKKYV